MAVRNGGERYDRLAVTCISALPGTSVRLTAQASATPRIRLNRPVQAPRMSEFFSALT